MKYILRITLIIVFCLLSAKISDASEAIETEVERPLVLFVMVANGVTDALWYDGLVEYSNATADAYDMDLEQIFTGTVRPVVLKRVEERLKQTPKPDYLIFGNQRGLGVELLEMAEKYEVDTFLYIAPLLEEDYTKIGGPRGRFKHWIGQLMPDDEQAGFDLANLLIADARQRKKERGNTGPISMIGIMGRRSTTSSQQRYKGLLRALETHDDIIFHQTVSARWEGDVAAEKYRYLKMRYGTFDVVWSANDPMALGVVEAMKPEENPPSVGGVDWIPPALQAVRQGQLVSSMGGHNFDIAYVMVLLRHHFDGLDFADVTGLPSLKSNLVPMTRDTLEEYEAFISRKMAGDIDYRSGFAGLMEDKRALESITMRRFIKNSNPVRQGGT